MCKSSMRCHALGWGGRTGVPVWAPLAQVIPAVPPVGGWFEKCACSRLCPPPPPDPEVSWPLGAACGHQPSPGVPRAGPQGHGEAAGVPAGVQPMTVQRNHCWEQGWRRVLSPRQDQTPSSRQPDPPGAP